MDSAVHRAVLILTSCWPPTIEIKKGEINQLECTSDSKMCPRDTLAVSGYIRSAVLLMVKPPFALAMTINSG